MQCFKSNTKELGCPADINRDLDIAITQIRRFDNLNTMGAESRCLTAVVITSPIPGFYESCVAFLQGPSKVADPVAAKLVEAIVVPPFSSTRKSLEFDTRSKDELYFHLVLLSAAIGSLVSGMRSAGFTTIRDLILGLGTGFAVYLILRSGNFVFLTGPSNIDILNPYSAAAIGMIAGLFSERLLRVVDGFVGAKPATAIFGGDAPVEKRKTPDGQKQPESGKSQQPDPGKSQQPDPGKSQQPDPGKSQQSDPGKSKKPDTMKSQQADSGDTEKAGKTL